MTSAGVTTDEQHAAPLSVDAVAPGRWRGKIQQYGQQRSGASAETLEQGPTRTRETHACASVD
jgi:hypothetical protein